MMQALLRRLQPGAVTRRLGWTVGSFGGLQVIRLATNVALTRLLAPEVFGIMQIVNAVKAGAELLSDVGIGQNIVVSRNGDDPDFLRTAWTLQVMRGLLMGGILALSASVIGHIYPIPELAGLLIVMAAVPLLAGLESPARFVLQRRHQLERVTLFELFVTLVGAGLQLAISWYEPTAWSLVYGAVAGMIVISGISFFIAPLPPMRFTLNRPFVREILHFGKWIFLATALYFVAMNVDRLYLGYALPLATLGIYGIARSLSEMIGVLIGRIGALVVFPAVAASRLEGRAIDQKVRSYRRKMLVLAAIGLGGFLAVSDLVVDVLYDDRYAAAGRILPILLLGIWFAVLSALGESLLLGCGKPNYTTFGNGLKLAWIAVAMPLAFMRFGFIEMVIVIAAADAVRYVPLAWGQKREGLFFPRQDLAATLILVAAAFLFRQAFHWLGLTGGWMALWT